MEMMEQNIGIRTIRQNVSKYDASSSKHDTAKQVESGNKMETELSTQTSAQKHTVTNGIQYDVSERTNQIAAWLKQMEKQEEEMLEKVEEFQKKEASAEEKNVFGQTEESVR